MLLRGPDVREDLSRVLLAETWGWLLVQSTAGQALGAPPVGPAAGCICAPGGSVLPGAI